VSEHEREFWTEIAYQEVFFERHAELAWPLLLAALKRMHVDDLRRVITVGVTHVDAKLVRVWLAHIAGCLEALPERPPVIDYYDPERRLATAMLLAWKVPRVDAAECPPAARDRRAASAIAQLSSAARFGPGCSLRCR
jgi:hypothetical protein